MKRTRIDDDFNPVYPYDPIDAPSIPFITPPFVSSNGLQEKPPGMLSLNYQDPITTQNGALTLKLGSGLNINQDGELTSDASVLVTPPITKANNTIGLAFNAPLTLQSDTLNLACNAPLTVQDNRLGITYNSPLTLQDSELALAVTPPLDTANNTLALKTARPIITNSNNELTLSADAPLNTSTGTLRLQSAAPLGLVDQTLRVLFSNPLYLQNNFLSLAIERPLALTTTGSMAMQISQPLKVEDGSLSLSIESPLNLKNGNLTLGTQSPLTVTGNNLSLTTTAPLTVQNNALALSVLLPLRLFNNTSLGVAFNPPISSANNGLSLDIGNGLTLQYNRLVVNIGGGLQFNNGAITASINAALPLQYSNNQLSLNIGGGLRYNGTYKNLAVKTDSFRGLEIDSNQFLVPRLGSGLKFDQYGYISVIPPTVTPTTLWTTADPSPNATFYDSLDAKVWLALVKCNGMVNGTIAIKALKGTLLQPTASFISFVMYFYSNGTRRTNYPTFENEGILASSATWGYRQGNSANTNVTSAVEFMPSSTRYPVNKGTEVQNMELTYTFLQGDPTMAISFQAIYNHALEGYSLKFTWRVRNRERFDIPCCSFSYITEE
ncbi:long fiber [Simian adenovirus 17]|uniref:Fiber-3 n=1 Tax=Simian adenovirus 17 TaxID=1715779 RepID=A0A2H4CK70_9ADEN|nr:long fiber [Simian adenovirus 17]